MRAGLVQLREQRAAGPAPLTTPQCCCCGGMGCLSRAHAHSHSHQRPRPQPPARPRMRTPLHPPPPLAHHEQVEQQPQHDVRLGVQRPRRGRGLQQALQMGRHLRMGVEMGGGLEMRHGLGGKSGCQPLQQPRRQPATPAPGACGVPTCSCGRTCTSCATAYSSQCAVGATASSSAPDSTRRTDSTPAGGEGGRREEGAAGLEVGWRRGMGRGSRQEARQLPPLVWSCSLALYNTPALQPSTCMLEPRLLCSPLSLPTLSYISHGA